MLLEPGVGGADAALQGGAGLPAEVGQPADVQQLARNAVGLAGVPGQLAVVAHHALHQLGQLADGDVLTLADVDRLWVVVVLKQEQRRRGQVVDVQELVPRSGGAPQRDSRVALALRIVLLRIIAGRTCEPCRSKLSPGP